MKRLLLLFLLCGIAAGQPPAAIPTGLSGANYQAAVNAWFSWLNTNKAATAHTHTGVYAPFAHVHIIADITSLQATLDAKEALANKDANGGYVGRDSSGNASVPGSMTAQKFVSSSTGVGVLEMLPGTAAAIIAATNPVKLPAAGNCALFLDSADSNKPKLIDHSGTVTAWTAGCATSGGGALSYSSMSNGQYSAMTNGEYLAMTN